jgi:eukaryotic-like serine/threonine-protein kinase
MQAERWALIERICQAALDRPPAARTAYLAEACAGDEALRREVDSLLGFEARAQTFIEAPPGDLAAGLMAQQSTPNPPLRRWVRHYEILSLLGAGGMGEVYLARDTRLKRKTALKLLPAAYTQNEERVRRFEREALAASALNHPSILTIYEIGESEGTHFIVTEYVEGVTLRQWLRDRKPALAEILKLAEQIVGALAVAHAAGVIHRDIKPENVMVRPDGLVKVLDFGLAKLMEQEGPAADAESDTNSGAETAPGMVMGTLRYMSPEQARGQKVDGRSDLFSLGVVLYELLTGQAPFTGTTTADLIAAILTSAPAPLGQSLPDVPEALERIIATALRKEREERYPMAQALLAELTELRQELELAERLGQRLASNSGQQAQAVESQDAGAVLTGPVEAADTGKMRAVLTGRYWFGQVKKRRSLAGLALLLLVLAGAAVFHYAGRASALTEKDVILLADFTNLTGEAAFDLTLKQALAMQLEQSPFLSLYPTSQVRETLLYMGRSGEERVTAAIAREICARRGIKAALIGSIAALGNHYVITLEAQHGQSGDVIARQQSEAVSKEAVLSTLGQAAAGLREKLGESLGSIQKFNAPFEQATTSSLEAFKQFCQAEELRRREKLHDAIPFYQRAVDLDPNFALAYARWAALSTNLNLLEQARAQAEKAYELRDRVSERERFILSFRYYQSVSGETERAIEVLEQWRRAYPRDYIPVNNLAVRYWLLGQNQQAIEAAQETLRRNPAASSAYASLGNAFLRLNRFAEAQASYEKGLALSADLTSNHLGLYLLAVINQDSQAMKAQMDWSTGKPEQAELLDWQAAEALLAGQLRRARFISQSGLELAERNGYKQFAVGLHLSRALREALCGNCRLVQPELTQALARERSLRTLLTSARVWAWCGDGGEAQALLREATAQPLTETGIRAIWLPVTQATLALQRDQPGEALQILQTVGRYEPAAQFWPAWLRGHAYLRQRAGAAAAAEFQRILDRRGEEPLSPFYPLAQLNLARAAALAGDTAKSRKAYQDFLALWKSADADLPLLLAARQEYARLK